MAEAMAAAEDPEDGRENRYDLDVQLGLAGRVTDDDAKSFMAEFGDVYSGGEKVEARGRPTLRGAPGPDVYEEG